MSDQTKGVRLQGIVRASRYDPNGEGKQFLGAQIEDSNGKLWVIDYEEQSPFHAFAGRQVVASGEPYKPGGQYLIKRAGRGFVPMDHFRVSTIRLVEVTPDAEFVEVGPRRDVCGRFERRACETGRSLLSFVTEQGDTFLVVNDPPGATVGPRLEVWAYPVQSSPAIQSAPERLWIICPCSEEDLWRWRERHS